MMRPIIKWILTAVIILLILVAVIILVRAMGARKLADLQIWHTVELETEYTAVRNGDKITLDAYLDIDARLFEELDQKVVRQISSDDKFRIGRYVPDVLNNPTTFPQNWNRTFELIPSVTKGGVLLLHGLTDSPYSLRSVAELLVAEGIYVLGLRLPGHGTIPAGIKHATRQDWMAAVRIGVRQVLQRKGEGRPFFIVGYSNGAALALKYAQEAVENSELTIPNQLILLSPAIGVTPFGIFADWHKTLSFIPVFRKFAWQNIDPEYDPFKYNSFPKNAGLQTYQLTTDIQKKMANMPASDLQSNFPPVIAFQSLVDDTVRTDAVVEHVFNRLNNPHNELILFDINRQADIHPFFRSDHRGLLESIGKRSDLPYRLTVITNKEPTSARIVAKTKSYRSDHMEVEELRMLWPQGIFSLSHVALPFPPDDVIYGRPPTGPVEFGINLGSVEPRGERDLLVTSIKQLMRLRHNPFFTYIERRIVDTVRRKIEESKKKE